MLKNELQEGEIIKLCNKLKNSFFNYGNHEGHFNGIL